MEYKTPAHSYAVIMAGGIGSRFWPFSRVSRPKQFLPLLGEESMLEATVARLRSFLPAEAILIVCGRQHAELVRQLLPWLPEENLLLEPSGRNTAPCLALTATLLSRRDPLARMVVLPADHFIGDNESFVNTLKQALQAAGQGRLLTIGIRPDRPETGYGYIEVAATAEAGIHAVESFHEKPDRSRALEFLKRGNFLWNSGIFAWQASTFSEQMDLHCPQVQQALEALPASGSVEFEQSLEECYSNLPSLSIDVGLLEPAAREPGRVAVIPAGFPWSDVGTWQALHEMRPLDQQGNSVKGKALLVDSSNCMVDAGRRTIALVGMEDTIVVETPDALLVCRMDAHQEVRKVIDLLKDKGWHELL